MSMKLLIICGPTATGKTDLGIYLARKFHGEIISADSRQVYQKMDIITGKDIAENSEFIPIKLKIANDKLSVGYRLKEEIPIWLVDIAGIEYAFNVGEYTKIASRVIEDISSRGNLPIIVGGTGLYIKSLLYPLQLVSIPPNKKLRGRLSKLDREGLKKYLQKINHRKWLSMNHSDRMNPRRLIRAIEITLSTKSSSSFDINTKQYLSNKDALIIGLTLPKDKLNQRIDERINKRMNEGVLEEAQEILQKNPSYNLPSLSSTGFPQLKNYLDGKVSLSDTILQWQSAEHAFAKRQLTWFKSMKAIYWYDVSQKNYLKKIERSVKKWYTAIRLTSSQDN